MSTHHAHSTKDFVEQLKDVRLKQGECIISYDVTALFTSVPIQPVLNIIQQKLANDKDLQQRTTMSIKHIISLLEFCLRSTYFVFQGQYYEQVEGAAMGSPLSPIVANIFMEKFETEALETAPHPPSLWERFVDDTFVILEVQHKEEFFNHINSIEETIKFTAETTKADGSMPFLDTLVTPKVMEVCQSQCTGSPLILISIYSGTATMPYPTNIVSSTHYYIGPKIFVPTKIS